jgi:hypothetical protein
MIIQNIKAADIGGQLALTWEVYHECKAITIQLATDIHCTSSIKSFTVAPSSSCILNCGPSTWYIRIGAWVGSQTAGTVVWSGIVGPLVVRPPNATVEWQASPDPIMAVSSTQPLVNGLRIHTNHINPFYMMMDYSTNEALPANETTTLYSLEVRQGFVDCTTLPSSHIPVQFNGLRDLTKSAVPPPINDVTYTIRITTFATETDALPSPGVSKQSTEAIIVRGKPKAAIRPHTTADHTTCLADTVLLREMKNTTTPHFTCYADYIRYVSAKARNS